MRAYPYSFEYHDAMTKCWYLVARSQRLLLVLATLEGDFDFHCLPNSLFIPLPP